MKKVKREVNRSKDVSLYKTPSLLLHFWGCCLARSIPHITDSGFFESVLSAFVFWPCSCQGWISSFQIRLLVFRVWYCSC